MHFALDGRPLDEPKTGVGHYTFELARSLAVIAPSDIFTLLAPKSHKVRATADNGQLPENLHEVRVRPGSLNWRWWSVGLPLYLRWHPLDLFHGTNYDVPLWARQPTVLTVHDLSQLLHSETHESNLVRRGQRRLPWMLRKATMIVTPTEAVKRELCEHLCVAPDKVAVTPEAPRSIFRKVELAKTVETRKHLGITEDFILFVGTVEPRKNLSRLVQAWEEILRTTDLSPRLVIAGKMGWLNDELMAMVRRSSFGNRICFTGYLEDTDLRALYSSCSVFVYPSLYEGFGLPPLEAMACGAPVISSQISAISEVVGKAACLVNPAKVQELAGAIVSLLVDKQAREQLSLAGLKRVEDFTWERTARCTLEVYKEALEMGSKR